MHPDWLGSPQHFVAGLLLAFVVALVAHRWVAQWWLVAALAIGVTSAAEIGVEIVEYPVLHRDADVTAYYDTIADLVVTMVGAIIGTAAGLLVNRARGPASRRGGL